MRKRTKENVLCATAIICLLVCIITARAVSIFHVQEMVLFSVSAVYLAVFIGVNRKKVLK